MKRQPVKKSIGKTPRASSSKKSSVSKFDPITLEIIQNSLQAISDEMFAAMRKTAMSAIIYEVLDMGTGITDGVGNLAASGAGIPAFVGVLDKAVQKILELNPLTRIFVTFRLIPSLSVYSSYLMEPST